MASIAPADVREFDELLVTGTDDDGRRFVRLRGVAGAVPAGSGYLKVWPAPGHPQLTAEDDHGGKIYFHPDRIEELELLGREDDPKGGAACGG
jgi:hypothetical protein